MSEQTIEDLKNKKVCFSLSSDQKYIDSNLNRSDSNWMMNKIQHINWISVYTDPEIQKNAILV